MTFLRNLIGVILYLYCGSAVFAQTQSSAGSEFWMGFMHNNLPSSGDLKLIISSEEGASGLVSIDGVNWSQSFAVNGGSTEVIIPASLAEISAAQVVGDLGVHIESDQPVSITAMNYESSTADATRIWPVEWLGTDYIVASYAGQDSQESEFLIVASEDNTEIEILPSVTTNAGNLAGQMFTVSLMRGQTYLVKAAGTGDLSGSRVRATQASGGCRPFAVFSGAVCAFVPSGCSGACDHLWEQNFPLKYWGEEYYISPWIFETDPDYSIAQPLYTYRIYAASNNTTVSVDGVTTVNLDSGEFQEYTSQSSAHCILAEGPVSIVQYMEGISCGGNGDPSMCILIPADQRSEEVYVTSPESGSLAGHYLNIVTDVYSLGEVSLDGNVISPSLFQSFPGCNEMIWCGLSIASGNHILHSPGGLSAVLYGHGEINSGVAESYAFSPGAAFIQAVAAADSILCGSSVNSIDAPAGSLDPYWKRYGSEDLLASGSSYVLPQPIVNSVYRVFYTEPFSGCLDSMIYSVESPEPLDVNIESGDLVLCEHTGAFLQSHVDGEDGTIYRYEWSPQNGLDNPQSSSPFASPDNSITYSLHVETLGNCASGDAQVMVNVNDGNVASFNLSEEELWQCAGDQDTMHLKVEKTIWRDNFDPGISWGVWSDIFGGAEDNICGSVSGFGLYFNGVYPREAITNPMDLSSGGSIYFSLKVANDAAPCDNAEPGDNIVLAYSVNNGPWTTIQTFYEAAYPDFVSVAVPIPPGAMNSSTRLRWRQVGSYIPNQDNWTLDNMYVGVQSAGEFTYQWNPADGIDASDPEHPIIQAEGSSTLTVSMMDASTGCLYSDSVFLHLGQPFDLHLFPDSTLCEASELSLYAVPDIPGEYSWTWSGGPGLSGMYSAEPIVDVTGSAVYQVEVRSAEGCVGNGEIQLEVSGLDDVHILCSDSLLCQNESTSLSLVADGIGDWQIAWSPATVLNASDQPEVIASPHETTTYICVVSDPLTGCVKSDEISIGVSQPFSIEISPDSVVSCTPQGSIVSVSSNSGSVLEFAWMPGTAVSDPTSATTTLSDGFNGFLYVTANDGDGCFAQDSIEVIQISETTDIGDDQGMCEDETILLSSGWGNDHIILWNTGSDLPQIEVNSGGVYSVEVWSPEGCYSYDEVSITEYSYPVFELGQDTSICEGEVVMLETGLNGYNFTWNTGVHSPYIYVNEEGLYAVDVDNGYCFSRDSVFVEEFPMPKKPFAEEITFCFDFVPDGFFLDARNEGSVYYWSNDSTGRVIQVTEEGEYSVEIMSEGNCATLFTAVVNGDCPQTLFAPNSFTPDGDGINDEWHVYGENIRNFRIRLFNRLGEEFWESTDIETPWLGQRRDGDFYVEAGVYPYIIDYQEVNRDGSLGDFRQIRGFVTLIR